MHEPRKPHWDAAMRVLRYIKGTLGQGLLLPSSNNIILKAYCDSDWKVVALQDDQFLDIVFFLEPQSFHGNPRSRQMFQDHQQKLNTEQWQIHAWN